LVFVFFQRFSKAAEDVKNLNTTPNEEELLELYALYKQGLVGDVNTGKCPCRNVTQNAKSMTELHVE
jgi:acyl-CoA-binding protein